MSDETEQTPAPAPRKPMPKIEVKNFIDGDQARKDASYSLADLSTAMQEQMAMRVHYGVLKAQAERQVADLKLKLEAAESTVYRQVRDELTKQSIKVTEALLEKEVAAHRTILAIKLAINEAKQVFEVAKAVYDAFEDRKVMLQQAGARDRAELEGELRLNLASARDEAVKSGAQDMLAKRNALVGTKQ
jgi:hypothetical protein